MFESVHLPKLGLKGAGAEAWLREQGVDVPPATYDTRRLPDGGVIARLGTADFFLEGGPGSDWFTRLGEELARGPAKVYRVERHDAAFVLSGPQALKVLAQMCSFDFRSAPPAHVVLTRAAGVNCTVLPEMNERQTFRIWVDCTYSAFFEETLREIIGSATSAH